MVVKNASPIHFNVNSQNVCGYKLLIGQNLAQKGLIYAKILLIACGGYFFYTPCIHILIGFVRISLVAMEASGDSHPKPICGLAAGKIYCST